MGELRVKIIDGEVTLVPDEEARRLLTAEAVDIIEVHQEADGRVVFSQPGRTAEIRMDRGRAFLEKYRSTFEALAK